MSIFSKTLGKVPPIGKWAVNSTIPEKENKLKHGWSLTRKKFKNWGKPIFKKSRGVENRGGFTEAAQSSASAEEVIMDRVAVEGEAQYYVDNVRSEVEKLDIIDGESTTNKFQYIKTLIKIFDKVSLFNEEVRSTGEVDAETLQKYRDNLPKLDAVIKQMKKEIPKYQKWYKERMRKVRQSILDVKGTKDYKTASEGSKLKTLANRHGDLANLMNGYEMLGGLYLAIGKTKAEVSTSVNNLLAASDVALDLPDFREDITMPDSNITDADLDFLNDTDELSIDDDDLMPGNFDLGDIDLDEFEEGPDPDLEEREEDIESIQEEKYTAIKSHFNSRGVNFIEDTENTGQINIRLGDNDHLNFAPPLDSVALIGVRVFEDGRITLGVNQDGRSKSLRYNEDSNTYSIQDPIAPIPYFIADSSIENILNPLFEK